MNNDLKTILSSYSPSGCEKKNSKVVTDILLKYTSKIDIDNLGNIIGYYNTAKSDKNLILLDAHFDEVSLVVTEILDNGFLRFASHVGADLRCIIANDVVVHGEILINAVITSTPPHLIQNNEKFPNDSELFVDTGLDKDKLSKIVSVGDYITYKNNYNELLDKNIYSKGLDNKLSIFIILEVLNKLKQNNIECNIATLFSSGEEAGAFGAGPGAFKVEPDVAVVLDVSFANTPTTPKEKCGESSKGVMIGVSPTLDIGISNKMRELANTKDIPHQIEVMAGDTGTNATEITKSHFGIPTSLLSIPIKYMHTGIEMVNITDTNTVIDLLYEYILFVSKENRLC